MSTLICTSGPLPPTSLCLPPTVRWKCLASNGAANSGKRFEQIEVLRQIRGAGRNGGLVVGKAAMHGSPIAAQVEDSRRCRMSGVDAKQRLAARPGLGLRYDERHRRIATFAQCQAWSTHTNCGSVEALANNAGRSPRRRDTIRASNRREFPEPDSASAARCNETPPVAPARLATTSLRRGRAARARRRCKSRSSASVCCRALMPLLPFVACVRVSKSMLGNACRSYRAFRRAT